MQLRDKVFLPLIVLISVAVPVVVSYLFFMDRSGMQNGLNLHFLPLLNAFINSAVTVLLLAGYYFIRTNRITAHRTAMVSAFSLSALFLVSYVVYHTFKTEATRFGGEGWVAGVYYFILISHILLATAILPMTLLSIYRALQQQWDKHRKIAKWTFPIWLYVSITGVVVYLMISPYYPS
jgi:putative membrane protein